MEKVDLEHLYVQVTSLCNILTALYESSGKRLSSEYL